MGGKLRYPVYKWTRHIEKCKTRERTYVFVILFCTFPMGPDRSLIAYLTVGVVTTKHQWPLLQTGLLDEMKNNAESF